MVKYAGVDFSMTSPAITTFDSETEEWRFHFYTSNKKLFWKHPFYGTLHEPYDCQEERFDNIACWAMDILIDCDKIILEGYAFGAKGLVFHIGENTGVLKNFIWKSGKKFQTLGPTELKKYATGKGNAKKPVMEEFFKKLTSIDVRTEIGQSEKNENPSSDIIDSYFLCLWGFTQDQQ